MPLVTISAACSTTLQLLAVTSRTRMATASWLFGRQTPTGWLRRRKKLSVAHPISPQGSTAFLQAMVLSFDCGPQFWRAMYLLSRLEVLVAIGCSFLAAIASAR